MARHSKPDPGTQARQEKGYATPRQADKAWQPPTPEQIAADVAQIDSQTYSAPEEPENAYDGWEKS